MRRCSERGAAVRDGGRPPPEAARSVLDDATSEVVLVAQRPLRSGRSERSPGRGASEPRARSERAGRGVRQSRLPATGGQPERVHRQCVAVDLRHLVHRRCGPPSGAPRGLPPLRQLAVDGAAVEVLEPQPVHQFGQSLVEGFVRSRTAGWRRPPPSHRRSRPAAHRQHARLPCPYRRQLRHPFRADLRRIAVAATEKRTTRGCC